MTAQYLSPNGHPIIGTLEELQGCARITGIDPATGEPEYEGETDIYWDAQATVHKDGRPVFLDDDGGEWTFDQLVLGDGEEG